jgi:S-adenosylmethionine decarboxylase
MDFLNTNSTNSEKFSTMTSQSSTAATTGSANSNNCAEAATESDVEADVEKDALGSASMVSVDHKSDTSAESPFESGDEDEFDGPFEGPEKTMEVVFQRDVGADKGLRSLSRKQLDHLCTLAKCSILTHTATNHLDAYVLSESSLFVYKNRLIMKTCGTTTLLHCLNALLEYADELGMELTWVGYSRKNLNNPDAQMWPHSNFQDEITYLNTHANLQDRLHGSGHILGPVTGDHWFVYVADLTHPLAVTSEKLLSKISSKALTQPATGCQDGANMSMERTVNVMMFDIDPDVASIFFKSSHETAAEMTKAAGINNLCPGATIDDMAFTPCGYSMNAILHESYYTMHITPESDCSYVSFETNTMLPNYNALIRNVINKFRPRRFVLTMFGHEDGVDSMEELPTDLRRLPLSTPVKTYGADSAEIKATGYVRTSMSSTKVGTELCCMMSTYALDVKPHVMKVAGDGMASSSRRARGYSLA